jgi:hypothetical protein
MTLFLFFISISVGIRSRSLGHFKGKLRRPNLRSLNKRSYLDRSVNDRLNRGKNWPLLKN